MRKFLTALGIVAFSVSLAGVAEAKTPPKTFAQVISVTRTGPHSANIRATYRCTSESGEPGHLWISVKQAGDGKASPALAAEGSSEYVAETGGVWAMTHADTANCDGRTHVGTFPVDTGEPESFGYPEGEFQRGWVWAQFCLFDDTHPLPADPNDFGEPVSSMVMRYMR